MDGENAGAHDLGDKGRGIGRERQRQRHEFRNDARAAGKIEPLENGNLKGHRRAKNQRTDERQADERTQYIGPDLDHLAVLEELPARIAPQPDRDDNRNQEGQHEGLEAGITDRLWNYEAAIAEKETAEQRDALPWAGERGEHRQIPEQDLEQQRQIAHKYDIPAGESRQQPVR